MVWTKWMFAAILTVAFGYASYGLECYQCVYCDDPFKLGEANIVNCTGSCEKAKRKGKTVRLCSPDYVDDNCIFHLSQQTLRTRNACACNKDLCNRGRSSKSAKYMYIMFCVIMTLFIIS